MRGGKREGAGRKPRLEGNRDARIQFMVDDAEMNIIKAAAHKHGTSCSGYLRSLVLRDVAKREAQKGQAL